MLGRGFTYLVVMRCSGEYDRPLARYMKGTPRPDLAEEDREDDPPEKEYRVVHHVRCDGAFRELAHHVAVGHVIYCVAKTSQENDETLGSTRSVGRRYFQASLDRRMSVADKRYT